MPNNHVQFRWNQAPSYDELQATIAELGHNQPRPIISINVKIQDIKQEAIESLMALAGEHGIGMGMTLTAVYEEGRQLFVLANHGPTGQRPSLRRNNGTLSQEANRH